MGQSCVDRHPSMLSTEAGHPALFSEAPAPAQWDAGLLLPCLDSGTDAMIGRHAAIPEHSVIANSRSQTAALCTAAGGDTSALGLVASALSLQPSWAEANTQQRSSSKAPALKHTGEARPT